MRHALRLAIAAVTVALLGGLVTVNAAQPPAAVPTPEHPAAGSGQHPPAWPNDQIPVRAAGSGAAGTSTSSASRAMLSGQPAPFLTRPYLGWHSLNSWFDHCHPDYSEDYRVCNVEGTVGLRTNGYDPNFPKGLAATPGGKDYVYYDGHNGYDLGLVYEPLLAAAGGTVTTAGIDPVAYNACYGQTVVIDHGNGISTRYAHMLENQVAVSVGQTVARGQYLGVSGTSGCSTGPHLHFSVYINNPWTVIDPWGWQGTASDPYGYDIGDLWLTGSPHDPLPDPPQAVSAVVEGSQVVVSWTPGFDGGEPITGYTVTASPGGASVHVAGSTTSALFSGLAINTARTFTVTATNVEGTTPPSAASNPVTPVVPPTYHYFAEGYTGPGFTESLSLFMPAYGGRATVDYYTGDGHTSQFVDLVPGRRSLVDVNAAMNGTIQNVSARVTLPGPGVVERHISFGTAIWLGVNDEVGVAQPAREWDFAEGSTLKQFSEWITVANPGVVPAKLTVNFFTSTGAHPTRTFTVGPQTRYTIDVTDPNEGVGRGIEGVAAQVLSDQPVVAERPMYVNGYDFGSGVIRDGTDAFGVNAPGTSWTFAEGTTLPGFNEYVTIENPNPATATVQLRYTDQKGLVTNRQVGVPALGRSTIEVFGTAFGVGKGVSGVALQLTSDKPVVAERPMYLVADFGYGPVAGAHDAPGGIPGATFAFAGASTLAGDSDYLTIFNPGPTTASVSVAYYVAGGVQVRIVSVPPSTRHTILLKDPVEGVGPNVVVDGIVVTGDHQIDVEKPTYSVNAGRYGAAVTEGLPLAMPS